MLNPFPINKLGVRFFCFKCFTTSSYFINSIFSSLPLLHSLDFAFYECDFFFAQIVFFVQLAVNVRDGFVPVDVAVWSEVLQGNVLISFPKTLFPVCETQCSFPPKSQTRRNSKTVSQPRCR